MRFPQRGPPPCPALVCLLSPGADIGAGPADGADLINRRGSPGSFAIRRWSTTMVGSSRLMGADFRSLRKQEVNMAHPTPFEAIAATIESANIDFPDAGDGLKVPLIF